MTFDCASDFAHSLAGIGLIDNEVTFEFETPLRKTASAIFTNPYVIRQNGGKYSVETDGWFVSDLTSLREVARTIIDKTLLRATNGSL